MWIDRKARIASSTAGTSDPLAIANVMCDHPCTCTASGIFETMSPSTACKHGVVDLLRSPNCRESRQIAVTYVPLRTHRCPFTLKRLLAAAAILAKRRLALPRYSNTPSDCLRALAELICRPRFVICRLMAILKFSKQLKQSFQDVSVDIFRENFAL